MAAGSLESWFRELTNIVVSCSLDRHSIVYDGHTSAWSICHSCETVASFILWILPLLSQTCQTRHEEPHSQPSKGILTATIDLHVKPFWNEGNYMGLSFKDPWFHPFQLPCTETEEIPSESEQGPTGRPLDPGSKA